MSDRPPPTEAPPDFDEAAYMVAFPRIAEAIRGGTYASALQHYLKRGHAEGRLAEPRYLKALLAQQQLKNLGPEASSIPVAAGQIAGVVDSVMAAPDQHCVVIGWVDDRIHAMTGVKLLLPDGRSFQTSRFGRCRRADGEAALGCPPGHLLGYWAILPASDEEAAEAGATIVVDCGATSPSFPVRSKPMRTASLRDAVFEYLALCSYFGAPPVEGFLQLEAGCGDDLLALNQGVSSYIIRAPYIERHGPHVSGGRHARRFKASIVVCLFGKIEYFFLQAALFSAAQGADEYEYVYVCNSPELTEALQREAKIATRIYGFSFTLVFLCGNAGFGAANNVAVQHAASDHVMIVNPDVFPRTDEWPRLHEDLLAALPAEQRRMFGAPLFYDDGALMHGGMYFECDTGLSVKPEGITARALLRVEHYGKGSDQATPFYKQSRKVPAVTGAFISIDRDHFERLGGFAEEYAFGHYEDADLSLKSWQAGQPVWFHDFPLWHLEGKGSVRKPAHEGGSIVNRWHFTRTLACETGT